MPPTRPSSTNAPSAARIREILGENLRQLCSGRNSVSETCRRIGINRTQFNRYLNGEAFPRPDILARICEHFDVDANILIRPLQETSPTPSGNVLQASFQRLASLLPGAEYDVPEALLPSGIYRSWRRSYVWRDHVFATTCRIWRDDGLTCWKAYEPTASNLLFLDGQPMLPERKAGQMVVMRAYRGCVLNVNHSLCILSAPPGKSPVIRMTTLRSGFAGLPQMYAGLATLAQAPQKEALTAVPVVFEHQAQTWRKLLAQTREQSFFRAEELPPRLARYLFDTPVI